MSNCTCVECMPDSQEPSYDELVELVKERQSQVEQLQADNVRLREALLEISTCLECYGKSFEEVCDFNKETADYALASTDNSKWLAEQKAQWRREVAQIIRRYGIDWQMAEEEILRMAEQPK